MAWIESHDTIWEHHKTIKLCQILKIGRAQAVGHLHGIWHFVLRNAWKDANLEPWGATEIARAAWFDGDADSFVNALRDAGFLDDWDVHDWMERAGRLVGDRLYNEQRRKTYVKRRKTSVATEDLRRKSLATLPYHTIPNPTNNNDGFDVFWNTYPKRVGKGAALKAWKKINPTPELVSKIMGALSIQAKNPQWAKDGGQFCPHPATWLNQARYEDHVVPTAHPVFGPNFCSKCKTVHDPGPCSQLGQELMEIRQDF